MRRAFIRTLVDLATDDERIVLMTGDLGYTVVEPFAERFPARFFNVGVAEQNLLGLATGLVIALFPAAAAGGGLVLATTGGGALLGAVAGHAAAGMSRKDLKEAGEALDEGTAGLVVVGVSDMQAKVEKAMKKAKKIEAKQLKADEKAIEADAKG